MVLSSSFPLPLMLYAFQVPILHEKLELLEKQPPEHGLGVVASSRKNTTICKKGTVSEATRKKIQQLERDLTAGTRPGRHVCILNYTTIPTQQHYRMHALCFAAPEIELCACHTRALTLTIRPQVSLKSKNEKQRSVVEESPPPPPPGTREVNRMLSLQNIVPPPRDEGIEDNNGAALELAELQEELSRAKEHISMLEVGGRMHA